MKTVFQNRIRKGVDVCMTVILLLIMAYQVTGEALHEWLGVIVTILVIIHQILNRKWYASLFRGKYNPYRMMTTVINVLLIASFLLTAVCGMAMSSYSVPFLYGMVPVSFARRMHLSLSHWAFVRMGVHLGLHIPAMTAGMKLSGHARVFLAWIGAALSGYGLYLFLSSGIPNYLFFRVPFAFYAEKVAGMVIFEAVMILVFWVLIGSQAANLCRIRVRKQEDKKKSRFFLPVILMAAAVLVGTGVYAAAGSADQSEMAKDWSMGKANTVKENQQKTNSADGKSKQKAQRNPASADDGFVRVDGSAFLMGSPASENWRGDDETQLPDQILFLPR